MKLKLEDWTSIASLGLCAMFVVLLLSFYNFLVGPEGKGPESVVDPGTLILQETFISGAPSVVLAGFVFGMSRTFGTRLGGLLLLASGVLMIAGMVASIPLLSRIPSQYVVGIVAYVPYFFMATGAGVAALGGYLIAATKRKPISSDLDDLR
jgi:hypothetical protein